MRHLFMLLMLASTAGCLSFGGGDTYVQEKPETIARICELENRMSMLEQSVLPSGEPEELPSE